ncbi:hypothetical protein ZWY2020_058491 [Hordeum vulgare]|nr:hypothetical protein ZWY2020_058491 [Hordeum vulgare]
MAPGVEAVSSAPTASLTRRLLAATSPVTTPPSTPTPLQSRTAASPGHAFTAALAVGDISVAANLYATAATSLPPGLMVYSLSREAWSKESNWIGYVAVSTDAAAAVTDQRVIYVALRGTIRNLEWVDVLKPDLIAPDTILLEGDPARGHVGVMKGWYVIYTSTDERSPFSSTTRATSSWPLCGNWSPSTSRAPIHISSGKKNLFRKAGC